MGVWFLISKVPLYSLPRPTLLHSGRCESSAPRSLPHTHTLCLAHTLSLTHTHAHTHTHTHSHTLSLTLTLSLSLSLFLCPSLSRSHTLSDSLTHSLSGRCESSAPRSLPRPRPEGGETGCEPRAKECSQIVRRSRGPRPGQQQAS